MKKTIAFFSINRLIILLIGLFALIVMFAYGGYQYFSEKIINDEQKNLLGVLQMKVAQIERIMAERHGDAEIFILRPAVWKAIVHRHPTDLADLKQGIAELMTAYDYQRILVFDKNGQLIAANGTDEFHPDDKKGITAAIAQRDLVFVDLHHAHNNVFCYGIAHPIFANGDKNAEVVGVVYLEKNAEESLFPLLHEIHATSSSESLLARREGNEIVFLSKLKFKPEAKPLTVRLPLIQDSLAARGLKGEHLILSGIDYRGVPVLGAVAKIDGTPWVLVTKVDRTEIEALASKIGLAMASVALFAALLLIGIGILWWRNTVLIQKQQYAADLHRSHALLAMAEKITKVGSWDYQIATNVITWSDEMFHIFRRDPAIGVPTFPEHALFFPPEDMARLSLAVENALAHGTPYQLDLRILRCDNTVGWGVLLANTEIGSDRNTTRIFGSFQDITERKRNEDLLRLQSEITANAAVGVASIRAQDGIIVYTNRYFDNLFGYAPGELIGQSIVILNAPTEYSAEDTANKIITNLKTNGQWHGEVLNRKKDGTIFWTFAAVSTYQHPDHETVWISYQSDISQQKSDQANLKRDATVSQNLLSLSKALISPNVQITDIANITLAVARLLTDSVHGYVSSINPENGDNIIHTLTTMMNNNECNLTSDQQQIIFKREANGQYVKLWGHALNTRQGFYTNQPAIHPAAQGTPPGHIPMHGFLTVPVLIEDQLIGQIALANPNRPYTDNDLAVIEQVAVIYASSLQRKRIEDKLIEKEKRYHAIFENAMVGIARVSITGQFLEVNQEFCRIVGYSREEILAAGFSFQKITHPDDLEGNLLLLHKTLTGECDSYTIEKRYVRKDENIVWTILSVYLCRDAKGEPKYLLGAAQDINERKRMEQDLIAARDAANASAKAKSEFLANMSHEIRTPMNGVIGLTQLALAQPLSEKVRDYLEKVEISSHSLLRILNDILDYSKIEAGRLTLENRIFDLEELLNTLRHLFTHHAEEKKLSLFIALVGTLPYRLVGDALRLQQILSNLLGNAIKFTERGSVALSVTFLGMEQSKTKLIFSVVDTGIGMSPKVISYLFQPFTQADASISRRFGGTGLGLTISRRLLHLLGSEFQVESALGKGSKFSFELLLHPAPIILGSDPRPGKFSMIACSQSSHQVVAGARVLLAEDNLINQQVVREFLLQHGVRVTIANNGYEVITLLERADYDLILMDVHMPKMDGLEATRYLRQNERFAQLPIIALTASVTEEERERALDSGMNGFLAKPIDPDQFIKTLVRYLPPRTPDLIETPLPTPQPTSESEILFKLDGFNLDKLIRLMGSAKAALELLERFDIDAMETMEQFEIALTALDFTDAQHLIHRLKGMAGNVGATDLYNAALALEKELKQNLCPDDLLSALHNVYQTTRSALQNLPHPAGNSIITDAATNPEKFRALAEEIDVLLISRELVSNELMEQLAVETPPAAKKIYQQLNKHVQNFNYAQASVVLRQLINGY